LLELFGHKGKNGQQFHHDLDDDLPHGRCGRNIGINIQSGEEMVDGLEDVDECIIARTNVFGRLIRLVVTRVRTCDLKGLHTASSTAKPANIAFAGGND